MMNKERKVSVLLIDDEPNIIRGMRRMLIDMEEEWSLFYALSGHEALDIMKHEIIDVVISDMRMPGMDGAELFTKVQELYPETVRIILSGFSEQEIVLKTVNIAHQFIAKPCDADTIKNTVYKSMSLRKLFKSENVQKAISSLTSIPVLPETYQKLIHELQDPEVNVRKISNIISKDVAISAYILKLINSAFFGLPRKVQNIFQAVSYLGINIIRSLIIYGDMFSKVNLKRYSYFDGDAFNRHSIVVAKLAMEIVSSQNGNAQLADKAFIAGMLHDFGKLLLLQIPDYYGDESVKPAKKIYREIEEEYEVLQVSHAEIGAYLLGLWGFDDDILEATAYHHHPSDTFGSKEFNLLTAVHVAEAIVMEMDVNKESPDEDFIYIDKLYLFDVNSFDKLAGWKTMYLEMKEEEAIALKKDNDNMDNQG